MEKGIPKLEKRIIVVAFVLSAIHLSLIGYAAWRLGIRVPSCVTNVKPYTTGRFIEQGPNRYEVHMVAKMWGYEPNVIRVPAGSTVDFYLISKDITHGFYIDNTNVNLMAVPNVVNYAQARFPKTGTHNIMCHEYCGAAHHQMHGVVEVLPAGSAASVDGLTAPASSGETLSLAGRKLVESKGCLVCHSLDGSKSLAPTFKGMWGRTEALTDGTSVVIDENYVRESIQNPQKKVAAAFAPLMPILPMSDTDIQQIIDYLKTFK